MANSQTLLSSITTDIENQIIEGTLKPGDKIPNEQELMARYQVSRSTLREAIKLLTSNGTLEIRRGKGTFVCQTPGMAEDPLGLNFIGADNLDKYLYEARLIFEPEIARLSALRATESEIKTLRKLSDSISVLDTYLEGADTDDSVIENMHNKDKSFHIMLCKTCRNPVLERLVPIIIQSITFSYEPKSFKDRRVSGPRKSTHGNICDAIANRDAEKAKQLMFNHLYNLKG